MVSLELGVGRSVGGAVAGVEMSGQTPAIETPLTSQCEIPHSAGTQHSGPLQTVIYITVMVRYWFMVSDVLPTSNTATTPGTLRTLQTLITRKLYIYQLVKITLIEYLL